MAIVEVKIKCIVATSRYGTLQSGDRLRTDREFARHLVEDCRAAEYAESCHNQARPPTKKSRPAKPNAKQE
jgi:hypothetical protein